MTIYEIINPSDKYTLESDDFAVACLATLMLGVGHWGLESVDDEGRHHKEMPLFLFGPVDEWFIPTFGRMAHEQLEMTDPNDIAAVLESVMIGDVGDRKAYNKALELIDDPEKRKQWRDHWHDQRRTSLNDIGARAWQIAEGLRNSVRTGMEPMIGGKSKS